MELILRSCFGGNCTGKLADPTAKTDRLLINIEFFVVEIYLHRSTKIEHEQEQEHEHDYEIYSVSISINSTQRLL